MFVFYPLIFSANEAQLRAAMAAVDDSETITLLTKSRWSSPVMKYVMGFSVAVFVAKDTVYALLPDEIEGPTEVNTGATTDWDF